MIRVLAAGLAWTFSAVSALAGCGADKAACRIDTGEYHLALPAGVENAPVVLFLHGAGGNGGGVMRNTGLTRALLARGYAVLAPTATKRPGSKFGPVWVFYPGWEGRNELQFLRDVLADAGTRFGLNTDRVLLSGFSAGAFMVSYLACDTPDACAAYAPVSGGFWRPHPDQCAGPVKLFQTHGWADKTVPLEGRYLGGGRFQQGDIFAGLEIWRTANECADQRPDSFSETGDFWRRKWAGCAPGSALELAMFPGGHKVPKGWGNMVLDWFEAEVPE
jgi:polyhydroxybutyrate depolymerase